MGKHIVGAMVIALLGTATTRAQEEPPLRAEAWSGYIGDKALAKLPDPAKLLLDRKAFGRRLTEDGGEELPFKIGVIRDAKAFAPVGKETEGYLSEEKDAKPIWPRWKDAIDWKKEAVVYVVLTNHTNYLRFDSWKVDEKGAGRLQVQWQGILPGYVGYQACLFCRVPREGPSKIDVFIEGRKTAGLKLADKATKGEK